MEMQEKGQVLGSYPAVLPVAWGDKRLSQGPAVAWGSCSAASRIPVGSSDKILAEGGALRQTVSNPLSVPPLTSDSCLNLAGFAAVVVCKEQFLLCSP